MGVYKISLDDCLKMYSNTDAEIIFVNPRKEYEQIRKLNITTKYADCEHINLLSIQSDI